MRVRPLLVVLVALNILVWGGLVAFEAWVPTTVSATMCEPTHSMGASTVALEYAWITAGAPAARSSSRNDPVVVLLTTANAK